MFCRYTGIRATDTQWRETPNKMVVPPNTIRSAGMCKSPPSQCRYCMDFPKNKPPIKEKRK